MPLAAMQPVKKRNDWFSFIAGSPCEPMLNLDYCFIRDNLRSHALRLPPTRGLGITSNHRYALSLTLDGALEGEKRTLRLPRYHIRFLSDQAHVDATRKAWILYSGHRRDLIELTPDVDRRNDQLVVICQRVSATALRKTPDKRRRRRVKENPTRSPPSQVTDYHASILGGIRLYKCAVRMCQENRPLLPTDKARLKGISGVEEVAAGLA